MRLIFLIILFTLPALSSSSQDMIGVPGPVKFNDTTFYLTWSEKVRDDYYLQEYLPLGERRENFDQMMACHIYMTDLPIRESVGLKVKEIQDMQKVNPAVKFYVASSPDQKEYLVDYMSTVSDGSMILSLEFHVYRYARIALDDRHEVLFVLSYSRMGRGKDVVQFMKMITDERMAYLNELIAIPLPELQLKF